MTKFGKVSPENNTGKSLTQPVKTRSPMEAHQMLIMGQPIDVMSAYYDEAGLITADFWMQDKVSKLHILAELKATTALLESEIISGEEALKINHKQQQDEQIEADRQKISNSKSPEGNNQKQDSPGAIS